MKIANQERRYSIRSLFGAQRLLILFAMLSAFPVGGSCADDKVPKSGIYIGLEPMPGLGEGNERWYHQIRLTVQGAAVRVNAVPIFFKDGKRFNSDSDGGFWTYEGKVVQMKKGLEVELNLVDSSYVRIANKQPKWKLVVNADNTLTMNGLIYRPKKGN